MFHSGHSGYNVLSSRQIKEMEIRFTVFSDLSNSTDVEDTNGKFFKTLYAVVYPFV